MTFWHVADPDLEVALRFLEAIVEGNSTQYNHLLQTSHDPSRKDLVGSLGKILLPAHARGFDLGLLSVQQLMEALAIPFLSLAKRMNQVQGQVPEGDEAMNLSLARLHDAWVEGLAIVLGVYKFDAIDGVERPQTIFRPVKRLEFMKALLGARFHEVRSALNYLGATERGNVR